MVDLTAIVGWLAYSGCPGGMPEVLRRVGEDVPVLARPERLLSLSPRAIHLGAFLMWVRQTRLNLDSIQREASFALSGETRWGKGWLER